MSEDITTANGHHERLSYLFDIAIAVLLGSAAIATAWSAYQSSLWSGDQLEAFTDSALRTSEAALITDQASQAWTEGNQQYAQDQELFFEYTKAAVAGDADLALYLRESLMSDELVAAIEWWEDQPGDDPLTPIDDANPEYSNPSYESATALDEEAQGLLDEAAAKNQEGADAGDEGDKYDFVTVILAASLFIFGIAAVFRQLPVKIGMSCVGVFLLAVALVQLAGLDRA